MHQHLVFHVDRLSPWTGNDINGATPQPPPPLQVDNELKYEVECILDSRKYHNQYQYLVQWKGYDTGHNSWEPATNLTNSPDLINEFHSTYPSAPRQLLAALFATLPWQRRTTFTISPPCPAWNTGALLQNLAVRMSAIKEGVM